MRMGSDNTGDGLASQPCRYRLPGQPLVGSVSHSPDGLFAQQEGLPTRGRPAVRGKGTTRPPQPTPHTNTRNPPRGAQVPPTPPVVPPTPPVVPPARPIVPLHRHCAQQEHWPSRRPIDPTGGSSGRSDSQWASRAPRELRKMVSAHRGWGTQRANPGAPAAQRLCLSMLRGTCAQWATTGAPDALRAGDQAPGEPTLGPLWHSAVLRLHSGDPVPSGPPLGPVQNRAPGAHAHGSTERQVVDGNNSQTTPTTTSTTPVPHPAQPQHTNHWECGNNTDCPGPVQKQQPDGMSRRGWRHGNL